MKARVQKAETALQQSVVGQTLDERVANTPEIPGAKGVGGSYFVGAKALLFMPCTSGSSLSKQNYGITFIDLNRVFGELSKALLFLEAVTQDDKRATPGNLQNGVNVFLHIAKSHLAEGKSSLAVPASKGPVNFSDVTERLSGYETVPEACENDFNAVVGQCKELVRTDTHSACMKYTSLCQNGHAFASALDKDYQNLITTEMTDQPGELASSYLRRFSDAREKARPLIEKFSKPGYEITDEDIIAFSKANPVTISENLGGVIDTIHSNAAKNFPEGSALRAELKGLRDLIKASIDPEKPVPVSQENIQRFLELCSNGPN